MTDWKQWRKARKKLKEEMTSSDAGDPFWKHFQTVKDDIHVIPWERLRAKLKIFGPTRWLPIRRFKVGSTSRIEANVWVVRGGKNKDVPAFFCCLDNIGFDVEKQEFFRRNTYNLTQLIQLRYVLDQTIEFMSMNEWADKRIVREYGEALLEQLADLRQVPAFYLKKRQFKDEFNQMVKDFKKEEHPTWMDVMEEDLRAKAAEDKGEGLEYVADELGTDDNDESETVTSESPTGSDSGEAPPDSDLPDTPPGDNDPLKR